MKRTNLLLLLMALFLIPTSITAQMPEPVAFSIERKQVNPSEIELVFKGTIEEGWHVYSTELGEGGPTSAKLHIEKIKGLERVGKLKVGSGEKSMFDNLFNMRVRYFDNSCTFTQRFKVTQEEYAVQGYLEYGACNDESCLPPTSVDFDFTGKGKVATKESDEKTEDVEAKKDELSTTVGTVEDNTETTASSQTAEVDVVADQTDALSSNTWWSPVIDELKQLGESTSPSDQAWWKIFLMGFVGGLIALFTPCVWPIIPMTVSFFLKRSKDKKKGLRDAISYGISIVFIYVALGLIITSIFGANALNDLSTNAVFNILFFLMLVVFAASFFGWFEISLPSKWSTAVDSKAEKTSGMLSIFLMAFTLSLVSFSCTGPIIGFLLVEVSTAGSKIAPTIGMFGFALALALPFTLFALFPTLLKQAPKSGNWMNNIKVCLGFLELAFALKFLSVADLAYGWHILDREVFLALWITLFVLLGAYLMGWFRFPHDEDEYNDQGEVIVNARTSVPKFFMAFASFSFAIYMIPGLWGAPLKAISAFAPPMHTQDFNLHANEVKPHYNSYELGMMAAREQGKPVILDFTGAGCVNCRKMEGAVWTDLTVANMLQKDYILIELKVDDKTPLLEQITIQENGRQRKLRTVGDKWSYLQRSKFGASAQPFYVLLDNEGKPLHKSYAYDEDVSKYIEFLQAGLDKYRAK